jgi:signal peptidase
MLDTLRAVASRQSSSGQKGKQMRRLLRSVLLALVAMALLAMITIFSLDAAGKLPYRLYLVHTDSMVQTIRPGSLVLVHENRYHVGQVITFKVNGLIVTHRLMAIHPNGTIVTKGDANPTVDPWRATKADIIGGVVRTIPTVGYVWFFIFMTWEGPVSILLAITFFVLLWLIPRRRERASPDQPLPKPGSTVSVG